MGVAFNRPGEGGKLVTLCEQMQREYSHPLDIADCNPNCRYHPLTHRLDEFPHMPIPWRSAVQARPLSHAASLTAEAFIRGGLEALDCVGPLFRENSRLEVLPYCCDPDT